MKLALTMLPFIICAKLFGQVTIKNMSSLRPDSSILFHQINNMIEVLGTTQNTIIISKNGATIKSNNNNTFRIKTNSLNPDTLLIYTGKDLLLKKTFRVDTTPTPGIQLGYFLNDTATIKEILAIKALHGSFKGSLYNDPIRILSFSTIFLGPDGDTLNIYIPPVEGNMLSEEQIAIIKELKQNSKIVFDAIIAFASNPKPRRLAPYVITIE